jgi:hypothetical protein
MAMLVKTDRGVIGQRQQLAGVFAGASLIAWAELRGPRAAAHAWVTANGGRWCCLSRSPPQAAHARTQWPRPGELAELNWRSR